MNRTRTTRETAMNPHHMVSIVLLCSGAAWAGDGPRVLPAEPVASRVVGHVYLNAVTGEKTASRASASSVRGLSEVWMADNDIPCAAVNSPYPYIGDLAMPHDNPAWVGDPDNGAIAFGASYLQWGDVTADTRVDVVQFVTLADHPDIDADGDGLADGVEGLGCVLAFFEGDNGFNSCFRLPLISFTLVNIPGRLGSESVEGYLYTIDLASDLGKNLSFELGDTDGDSSGAGVYNHLANAGGALDLDSDGLVDWSVAQGYIQPGTVDFDGDGVPDGDPANRHGTYLRLAGPRMRIEPDPPTRYTLLPVSAGGEDVLDVFASEGDGTTPYFTTVWLGGFTCDRNGNGVFDGGDDVRPHASFFIGLFQEDLGWACCPPDIGPDWTCGTGDGVLNFFDIANYLAAFAAGSPHADYFPIAAADGVLNFFDLSTFLAAWSVGCP